MLLHDILALPDGLRYGNAIFTRHHGAGQPFTILIVVVQIELDARNGIPILSVRLGQSDPAFGWLVLTVNLIGFQVFLVDHDLGGEMIVHIMKRDAGFLYLIGSPGQQGRKGDTLSIRGDHGHHFAIVAALMGRQTRNAGDGKLRPSQRLLGQFIRLDDLNAPLNGLIGGI